MNKTSLMAAEAFVKGYYFSGKNTLAGKDGVYLFGNTIARREGDDIILTLAGWNSMTTRNRLNAILHVLGTASALVSRNRTCYLTRHGSDRMEYVRASSDCWLRVKPSGEVIVDDRKAA